jgi:hypothetical protein
VAFATVLVATLLAWVPYSGNTGAFLGYDPGPDAVAAARTEYGGAAPGAEHRLARVMGIYNERRALGCEDAPDVLQGHAWAALSPPVKPSLPAPRPAGTPEPNTTGEQASLSGTHNWRSSSLVALTFMLLSFVVTIVVAVYGLRRMRLALKRVKVPAPTPTDSRRVKGCSCRILLAAVLAVGAALGVWALRGRLGFLGVPGDGIDLEWKLADASANLNKALGAGSLLASLIVSRATPLGAFLHACGGIALSLGYGAAVILVGAYGTSLLRARQLAMDLKVKVQSALDLPKGDANGDEAAKTKHRAREAKIAEVRQTLAEARTEIREGSADPKMLLYASGALFVGGLLAHATYRTAALAFLPSDRGHLQACLEALAQTETVCIAIVYSLFLAATYYPAASLIARRDRFLRDEQAKLAPEATRVNGTSVAAEEGLDVLGILKRLLVVVAPVVATLLVELLDKIAGK